MAAQFFERVLERFGWVDYVFLALIAFLIVYGLYWDKDYY